MAWRCGGIPTVLTRNRLYEPLNSTGQTSESPDGPNYLQCMAVAHWACGDVETALGFIRKAQAIMNKIRRPVFSCWRYCRVGAKAFIDDLDEIVELINGDTSRIPRFMAAASEMEKKVRDKSD